MALNHADLHHPSSKFPPFTPQQRQELERLFLDFPRPSSSLLEQFIKDCPALSSLDKHHLKAWFHSRRLKEKRDEKLSPLINKNAELKAEHHSLLLRNNQLRNQTLLLNLENHRLKEQLELQLKYSGGSSSSALERLSRDSDEEEACQLANFFSAVHLREPSSQD